jgi:hypothetical protein
MAGGVHGLAAWLDPFMRFGWAEVLVPLASHYRPLWMALGIVAGYLALAVWLSTALRPRMGYAWWRRLHGLAFAVYALATIHGLATGSDTQSAWALGIYAGSVLLVGGLLGYRLLTPIGARGRTNPNLPGWSLLWWSVGCCGRRRGRRVRAGTSSPTTGRGAGRGAGCWRQRPTGPPARSRHLSRLACRGRCSRARLMGAARSRCALRGR